MPFGSTGEENVRIPLIVIAYAREAVRAGAEESVSWTVKLVVPDVVGVPEIIPEFGLIERPSGREPVATDQL